jgi:hypothetical protein
MKHYPKCGLDRMVLVTMPDDVDCLASAGLADR